MASLFRVANNTAHCLRIRTVATTSTKSAAAAAAFLKYPTHFASCSSTTGKANKSIKLTSTFSFSSSAVAADVVGLSFVGHTNSIGRGSGGGGSIFANNFQVFRPQQQQSQRQQQFRNFSSLQMPLQSPQPSKLVHQNAMAPLKNRRYISSKEITKNMTLYTNGQFKCDVDQSTLEFKKPTGNPLVLMMAWLMAKQKHLKKYAEIYTEMGFDVMVVHITPWQLLWPTKGTQIVAAETLKFLESNKSYSPIVVHGFSVGAYQFGEIMLQMARDMDRYSQVLNRIACQIWDSAADITEIPVGLPKSIFPKNPRMQSALRNYTLYHLKTFHNQATIHYMRSSQMFHSTILKKPALFFVSENDLIGPPASNVAVRENWERADIPVTFKCWERSLHAAHLIKHRDEYLEILFKHLESAGVLGDIGMKSRAKL